MTQFRKVCAIGDITPARPKRVSIGERELVLYQVQEKIYAIENICPHQQFALFHQTVPDGHTIACPMHNWSFDLRSGKAVTGSGRVRAFKVQIEDNDVYVGSQENEN